MTGVIASLLAIGVIAALMIVGIRMKLPPSDLEWREHLPPPSPPLWEGWIVVIVARFVVIVVAIVAGLLGAFAVTKALVIGYVVLVIVTTIGMQIDRRRGTRAIERRPTAS